MKRMKANEQINEDKEHADETKAASSPDVKIQATVGELAQQMASEKGFLCVCVHCLLIAGDGAPFQRRRGYRPFFSWHIHTKSIVRVYFPMANEIDVTSNERREETDTQQPSTQQQQQRPRKAPHFDYPRCLSAGAKDRRWDATQNKNSTTISTGIKWPCPMLYLVTASLYPLPNAASIMSS